MGVLGGVAKGAGAFAGVVVLLHVAVLVGLKLYMVDHDWDCYDPEEAGSFCEFYGCPAVPEYEHTGEFLRTFERPSRALNVRGGGLARGCARRNWRQRAVLANTRSSTPARLGLSGGLRGT